MYLIDWSRGLTDIETINAYIGLAILGLAVLMCIIYIIRLYL